MLIPKGTYKAKIVSIHEPRETTSGQFYVSIELDINGQKGFQHVVGYPTAVVMIYRSRSHWIGMTVDVQVRVTEHDNRAWNSFNVIWPVETPDLHIQHYGRAKRPQAD